MKYSKYKDGWYESEAKSEAQTAYERLKASNRTYKFADEKTKKQIAYSSDYYLQTVPESVKAVSYTHLSYCLKYADDSTDENPVVLAKGVDENGKEIGRASCRERV